MAVGGTAVGGMAVSVAGIGAGAGVAGAGVDGAVLEAIGVNGATVRAMIGVDGTGLVPGPGVPVDVVPGKKVACANARADATSGSVLSGRRTKYQALIAMAIPIRKSATPRAVRETWTETRAPNIDAKRSRRFCWLV